MTEIPTGDGLEGLEVLKDYGYSTAEEVFYLAQALGPELTDLTGVAPLEIQSKLAQSINLIPQAISEKLRAMELPMGVPTDVAPPALLATTFAPTPNVTAGSVNLIDDAMPAIRSQGSRGTCVAHAACSVLEYAFASAGAPVDLSEQFLYWNCKQVDEIPDSSGTWLRYAFPLISRDGVCPENTWPYKQSGCFDEGCGPPPLESYANALPFRHQVQPIPPTSVVDIKASLEAGKCVAFSVPVYRSWYYNDDTRLRGKINMPLPNDIMEGGHAMCFVGYEDSNDRGLGGGRFILRNSWGEDWATNSVFGAGFGSIPYAYIARHGWEAYTVM